jgi:hypothetical protein
VTPAQLARGRIKSGRLAVCSYVLSPIEMPAFEKIIDAQHPRSPLAPLTPIPATMPRSPGSHQSRFMNGARDFAKKMRQDKCLFNQPAPTLSHFRFWA